MTPPSLSQTAASNRQGAGGFGASSQAPAGRSGRAIAMAGALALLGLLVCLVASLSSILGDGVGRLGLNQGIAWAWDIAGFVFWIGIAHAGTLVSAILLVLRQPWRTGIHRFAETTTVIAIACALVYILSHLGRPWFLHWLLPLPWSIRLTPNAASPLLWDVFAVLSYAIVSVLFLYAGMVPDLALMRDRSTSRRRRMCLEVLALGFSGSLRQWRLFERGYALMAALATILVISVHSIVAFDFAVSIVDGWHRTLLPIYFVAGAIHSGSALLIALLVAVAKHREYACIVTERALENLAKIVLATGTMLLYANLVEAFGPAHLAASLPPWDLGASGGDAFMWARAIPWAGLAFSQLLVFRRARRHRTALVVVALAVNIGMWFERVVLIVGGLRRGPLPATMSFFHPTPVDLGMLAGSFGLFVALLLIAHWTLPLVPLLERPRSALPPLNARGLPALSAPRVSYDNGAAVAVGWFESPEAVRRAAETLYASGHENLDVYARVPLSGHRTMLGTDVEQSTARAETRLARRTLLAGFAGAAVALGLSLQTQASASFPSTGGRSGPSVPTVLPIALAVGLLCATVVCFISMWTTQARGTRIDLWQPARLHPSFANSLTDRYFLSVPVRRACAPRESEASPDATASPSAPEGTPQLLHTLASLGAQEVILVSR